MTTDRVQAQPSVLTESAPLFQSKAWSSSEALTALQPLTEQVVGDMGGLWEMGNLGGTLGTLHWRIQLSGECLAGALTDFSRGLISVAQGYTGQDQQLAQLFQQLQQNIPTVVYPGFEAPIGGGSSNPPVDPPQEIPQEPVIPEEPVIPDFPEIPEIPELIPIP